MRGNEVSLVWGILMKKKFMLVLILILTFSGHVTARGYEEHLNGFNKVISQADMNPYYKYGLYSARLIAVKNPEIYLKGDLLFAKFITTTKGLKQVYQADLDHTLSLPLWGSSFDFDLVDFNKYKIEAKEEIYPENYPVFNYLDERLTSITTILKVKDYKITSLEAINLRYIMKRIAGISPERLYIIFNKDNNAFLYDRGSFINCYGEKINQLEIKNPILVFNEKFVWYPLMERDDRDQDPILKNLISKIYSSDPFPELTGQEKELINKLKEVSSLQTEKEKTAATLFSIHSTNGLAENSIIKDKWQSLLPEKPYYIASPEDTMNSLVIKLGNYLSPNTAYLASFNGLDKISEEYLNNVGSKKIISGEKIFNAWGNTWTNNIMENNIDDSFRTKGGICNSQAVNLASVLDLQGIENTVVRFANDSGGHTITIVPEYNKCFSNGLLLNNYYNDFKFSLVQAINWDNFVLFGYERIYHNNSTSKGIALINRLLEDDSIINLKVPLSSINYGDKKIYEKIMLPENRRKR